MDKTFDPASVERRISQAWDEAEAFKAGRPERAGAKPFTIVIPPPNVTGVLHMGHALNNTLQDILCRFERMRGRDVLWQPGTDHAGIATQMVVERQLAERQEPNRRTLGRAKFLERVWAWKAESGGAIVGQLRRLGASCDWSRERFTMDDGLSRAVVKVFVELYKQGLIYKDKRLVNWDPKLLTAVSDIEVVSVETKGSLWHFRYPVVDAQGTPTGETIVVATTRPETMLGDTGVAVHPEDERYTHLHGKFVRLPLVGRLIPVVADTYSDPEKGTGAVKITPAHDFNDFEVGRRHDLALINILDAEARLFLQGNEAFTAGLADSREAAETVLHFHGLSREEARKRIVELLDERGLLERIEPHQHTVPHGDRSGVVIEPWLTDQWYADAKTLAGPALAAVRDGRTRFVPKNWEKTFFEWLENIQPWCISRQLWWGHQIPAWYGPDGHVFVEASDAEAQAAALRHYGKATPLKRDEDVLDTWFSSALWPFSTLGWPDNTADVARYYPTDVLVTGFDIIFFWVARMMMMGLHFLGEVPFRDVYMHALVRDAKGAKMSKSKGNVIDPLALVDEFGADALRFTLAAMAAQGRDIKLSTQRVEGYRNFATKLWNASRFAEMNGCERVAGFDPRGAGVALNIWILGETAKAQAEVTAAIETYRFNDAANAAYRFIWNIFCDWYVELSKPLLQGEAPAGVKAETQATTAFVLDEIVKLLHPFMPFITEELWAIKGEAGPPRETLLALAPWSDLAGLENAGAEAEIGWILDIVSEVRSIRSEMNVPAAAQIALVLVGAPADVVARAEDWGDTLKRMARLSGIASAAEAPPQSVQVLVRGTTVALPLQGVVDFATEKARLGKEITKLQAEAEKIEAKLGNADFIRKAREDVIEEQHERLEDARGRIAKLSAALSRIGPG
ncbi:MAG: valine--tRNA ligase [Beijerinckiaceae bacterium]|nr:valine--tRNA ligase [Beijerinckiaceae bacterium]